MALSQTIKGVRDLLARLAHDLHKAEKGNKAASQRVRTGTIRLEKLAKVYRKESIHEEKKRSKRAPKKAAKKAVKKSAPKKKGAKVKASHLAAYKKSPAVKSWAL